MMDNVHLIGMMLDREASVTYCNDYLLNLTGRQRQEVMGANWFDLFIPPENSGLGEVFANLLLDFPETWHRENEIVTKSGERRLIRWNNTLLRSESGEVIGTASIGEDITERNQAFQQIEHLNGVLKQALQAAEAANEAKRLFLASMSHELRTPLNAIIGFSEMIGSEIYGPLGCRKYAEYNADVLESGRHLLAMINSILDMARFDGGKMSTGDSPVSLRVAAREAAVLLNDRLTQRNVALRVEIGDDIPQIRVSPVHLRQLMINLLGNAVKFSRPGGIVTISAESEADGGVKLHVGDHGIGISARSMGRVFTPFCQANDCYAKTSEGLGLGLSICKGIADAYGSRIGIESQEGVGTTVTVAFPPARAAAIESMSPS